MRSALGLVGVRFNICRAVLDHYLKARIDIALPMAVEDNGHTHMEQLAGGTGTHHFDVDIVGSNGKLQRRADRWTPGRTVPWIRKSLSPNWARWATAWLAVR